MTAPSEIPQSLTRFRQQLRAAAADDDARPWRPQPRLIALGAVAAAAAAAAALTLPSGHGGSAAAAVLRRTFAAITPPPDSILHVKVVGTQDGVAVGGETWQSTDAPYALVAAKGPLTEASAEGDDGTTSYFYDAGSNTLYERPDTSSALAFVDPIEQVREALADGEARVTGGGTIDGVDAYSIALPHGVVGYFSTADYRPLQLDDPQRDGSVVHLHVVSYEYLPASPSNASLLDLAAQHPAARVDTNPADWPSGVK